MNLILASQSPRRKEILGFFSIPFQVRHSNYDEAILPFDGDPESYVRQLAMGKAMALPRGEDELILAADTIVYAKGKIYGKPKDSEEALSTLKELAGGWHSVYTGLALRTEDDRFDDVEETRVLFNRANEAQLGAYHKALHCSDKAGGYAIQDAGSIIVRSIEGCYYNVMGLPINTLNKLLGKVGLSLWDHLSPENTSTRK